MKRFNVIIRGIIFLTLFIPNITYSQSISDERETIIESVVKKCSPSIVGITVYKISRASYSDGSFGLFDRYYKSEKRPFSLGSGFLISQDGYILTNNHVIEGADEVIVSLLGGKKYTAKVIGKDKLVDIALLKIDIVNSSYLEFEELKNIRIGEWAIAMGNPFGLMYANAKPTVTAGIVSNIDVNFGYRSLIQTDAAINPGNSGGALLNSRGKIIGMNSLKYNAENSFGLGFAINPKMLQEYVNLFKNNKKIDRDFVLGIGYKDINEKIQKKYNLSSDLGVIIFKVKENSIASRAGIKVGDVIIEVDGTRIGIADDFLLVVNTLYKGKQAKIKVLRNNQIKELILHI